MKEIEEFIKNEEEKVREQLLHGSWCTARGFAHQGQWISDISWPQLRLIQEFSSLIKEYKKSIYRL